jgi:DHA3 family tetracycline resistance protein-like MFS transporter
MSAPTSPIWAPFRLREFRLLWTGMTVSLLGDGIFTIALAWQVYEISNAPTALSIVGIAMTVPHILLLLLGGAVSDRVERRRVMIVADLVRGLAVAVFGFLSITGSLELWHIVVIAAAFGAGTAFFGPAFDAVVPDLVPEDILPQANSLDQLVRPAAWRMLGPALGGWLIAAWGPGVAFLIDAATFVVSVICLVMMHPVRAAPVADGEGSILREIREGFRYVRSQRWLWGTFLAATFAYLAFLGPTEVLLPYVVKNDMGGSARDLGLIFAFGGIGAMASAVFVGSRPMPARNMTFIYLVWTASTLMVAGYGLATLPWQAMVVCLAFNALESAGTIVWVTTKQRLVPGRLLGRVSSFDWFISIGLLPLSFALTGPVTSVLGARATLIWAGVVGSAVTFAFLFLPGLRDVERVGHVRPARSFHAVQPTAAPEMVDST